LSCVSREDDAPDYEIEADPDCNFEQLTIDCAPLAGIVFKTDMRKAHQLMHGLSKARQQKCRLKKLKKDSAGDLISQPC
jgi:hypothetical protein